MKIAIIGLGYVGIQLAVSFGRDNEIIGFDLDSDKLAAYRVGCDPTGEVSGTQFADAIGLQFTSNPTDLKKCDFYIVAVPTPVNDAKSPDFQQLVSASRIVGVAMGSGAIVVYESTVYPDATEEICVPVLEESSGLKWKQDFHVGYSPERINPGDPNYTLHTISKVVSADDEKTLEAVATLYASIVDAGVHRAPSIRVAEAAKVIENVQRDLNIALVNEFAMIFDRLGIDTTAVLEAASTKWNFLPFKPGLVGGHCIGTDSYYLTHRAQMVDYNPEVILAGRRINDTMGRFVATKVIELMVRAGLEIAGTDVNVFGVTFKENCSDVRNSQVFPLIHELQSYCLNVNALDPLAQPDEVRKESGIVLESLDTVVPVPVVILAVPHSKFCNLGFSWLNNLVKKPGVLIDIKSAFHDQAHDRDQLSYWSL